MNQEIIRRYIAGDVTNLEKEQVVEWVKADKNNMTELFTLRKLYDITIWQQETKKQAGRSKIRGSVICRIASVFAVMVLLSGSFLYILHLRQQIPEATMQILRVPAGQRVELVLADGTSVWLNAGSTFTFPTCFLASQREVMLDGEGYFKVAKDEQKPFVVKTSSYDINVLGTEFNVMAYDKSPLFEVSLLKGTVEICSGETKTALEPQTRIYQAGSGLLKEEINNYDYLLWKDGLICFDDQPVDRMISKLELYFDTRIIVENESFMKKKYTGKFRTKDGIEHILRVFQLRDKFIYEKDDEKNRIIIR